MCSFKWLSWNPKSTLESLLCKKSFAFSTDNLLSIIIFLVANLTWSLKIFRQKSSSRFIKFGGLEFSENFKIPSHFWIKLSKSSIINSSFIFSASVLNSKPVLGGFIKTPRALNRLLSVSVFIFLMISSSYMNCYIIT